MKVESLSAMVFVHLILRASVMYMNSGEKIPIAAESSSMMMVFCFSFVLVFMSGFVPFFDSSSLG